MTLTGIAHVSIKIQNQNFKIIAWVAPTAREALILGYHWIKSQRTIFNTYDDVLHVGIQERITVGLVNAPVPQSTSKIDLQEVQHDFPPNVLEKFHSVILRFGKIFQTEGRLSRTRTTTHQIRLTCEKPFRLGNYRYSDAKSLVIREQLKEMLNGGIIERCDSPYSSPIVIVKKKDGRPRFCIDFRRLNSITKDTNQPIPRIHDALKTLGNAKIFSTLDLKNGYWQIPMEESAKKLTAFSTPEEGTYQFCVMPFGLKNAPHTFQRFMSQEVLVGPINEICVVYLDDIIIFSESWEEHLGHLTLVLERLSFHNLTCSLSKCHFGKKNLEYLGHNVTDLGNEAKLEHVQGIVNMPTPSTRKALQKFIGTCNWLREYIPRFAEVTSPMTDLLSSKTKYQWTRAAQNAFEEVKRLVQGPLKLSRPDPALRFILQTDASKNGIGAVLYQLDGNNERRIISYASAKYDQTQARYHDNGKECLAIVWAIKRYKHYLEDKNFILRTDSQALAWLQRFKTEKDKLSRWAILLSELNFMVEHVSQRDNELPDILSRQPGKDSSEEPEIPDSRMSPESEAKTGESYCPELLHTVVETLVEQVAAAQQLDPELCKIINTVKIDDNEHPTYRLTNGVLSKTFQGQVRILVPEAMKARVLYEYHDSTLANHPGMDETLRAIQQQYTWRHLRRDVRDHLKQCWICACTESQKSPYADHQTPRQPQRPWETIALDLMGPYPRSSKGKRFILVITDLFTRWVEAFPLGSSEVTNLIHLMEKEILPSPLRSLR